ncbi:hypothetical protein [Plantactinospora sp. GCM10030261]|uniref:hypothetical protein n=1 Tax=Plantactinospora sp. GCM10030261 TaxID=3273420 RepID=UPI003609BB9F
MTLVRRVIAYELGMWRSLFRWVLRRPAAEPGAETFSYTGVVAPMLWAFIVLSTVEIPILDLILKHTLGWPSLRKVAAALGAYGVLWMLGLWASMKVHPHVVGDTGIRIRGGVTVDLTLDWEAVTDVRHRYRSLPSSRTVQIEHEDGRAILSVGAGGQTSVDVVLREPTVIPLPKGPSEPVTEVRCYADDPHAFLAAAHARKGPLLSPPV